MYTKKQAEYQKQYYTSNPRGAYTRQRANARRRGLEWRFTFETWWEVWEASGKWQQRGMGKDKYCMSRRGDKGPYSPENVVIIPFNANSVLSVLRNTPHIYRSSYVAPKEPLQYSEPLNWGKSGESS
jgi:hypothetical protein